MTVTEAPRRAEAEFAVSGMTCGSCAARIEKTLGRQPGVATVVVNLASEKATHAVATSL